LIRACNGRDIARFLSFIPPHLYLYLFLPQRGLYGSGGQYCPFHSGVYSKADLII